MPWEKNYEEPDVLDRAMKAFWARGYEATSMSDLVEATGINRGSIYAAFCDKHTLFVRALKHYDHHHRSDFLRKIQRLHRPRQAILAVFETAIHAREGGKSPSGCLLVNTALELSDHDPEVAEIVRESLVEVEKFFQLMIEEGQVEGTMNLDRNPEETAQALLGLFLGLRVLSRSRPEMALLTTISKQAAMLLD
jgi:TetR/AcrR family transcriptional repressor of nem operon